MTRVSTRTGRYHAGVTLGSVLLGVFAIAMSIAGTGVALPDIGADLRTSGTALQWAITGYNLALASFTLVCGSLADLFGRRRTFQVTTGLFTGGSLICAVAPHILLFDLARAVAGIGAGGVMACGGALLAATFTGAGRTRAFAAMGTIGGAGVVLGPFLAGWLVTTLGWRASFAAFVVVGGLILAASGVIAESRLARPPAVDWPGAVTFVLALAVLMFGLNQSPQGGPGGPAGILVGLALLAVFVMVERRRPDPVLNLSLARNGRFLGWCVGTLSTSIGYIGTLVYLPIYLQGVNDLSARAAGLTMLMLTVPILAIPLIGGWLVGAGVSARSLMVLALALVAAGNGWLTVLHPGVGPAGLFGPLVTVGIGVGISFGITDAQAMNAVPPERVGMAAGFLSTLRNSGVAMMIALFGAALVALLQARLGSAALANAVAAGELRGPDPAVLAAAFTQSWQIVLWCVAGYCVVAAVVVIVLVPATGRPATPEPAVRLDRPGPEESQVDDRRPAPGR